MRWTVLDFQLRAHVLSFLEKPDRRRICTAAFLNAVDLETLVGRVLMLVWHSNLW